MKLKGNRIYNSLVSKKEKSLATNLVVANDYNSFNILLLNVNFDKSPIRLHFLFIYFMLAKCLKAQSSTAMLTIKCLNFKFSQSNIIHKK